MNAPLQENFCSSSQEVILSSEPTIGHLQSVDQTKFFYSIVIIYIKVLKNAYLDNNIEKEPIHLKLKWKKITTALDIS